MRSRFGSFILNAARRVPLPIGVYAGLELTGASVKRAVSDPGAQSEAVLALQEYFQTDILLTAMDLSAEAEAFGCQVRMEDDDIPTVIGRLVSTATQVQQLQIPTPGLGRTAVHLETARRLVSARPDLFVLGGVIGPFSLAGRLYGVSETLELSLLDPELLTTLLEKATSFLSAYVNVFHQAGAAGVIMAEPAAGLLSPRGLGRFSSPYVHQIIEQNQAPDFTIILHNCGARLPHLPKIMEAGAELIHFGAPMDILQALNQVGGDQILGGNLDPTGVFFESTPSEVHTATTQLMQSTNPYSNFIISSGCDIPPHTPLANLAAFYQAVREFSA